MVTGARRATRGIARVLLVLAAVVLPGAGSCGRTDDGGTGQNPPPGQPAPTATDDRDDPGPGPATNDGNRDG